MKARSRKFDFTNSEGQVLSGRLELPLGVPKAYAVFAHCFTCSKNIAAASRISRALTAYGIATLRFDFTGLGNSDGDFANTNFSSNAQDLLLACEALKREYQAPSILIGHSLGGAAVLKVATHDLPELKAVVTIGAPSDISHVSHLFADSIADIEKLGEAHVQLAGRPFKIKKQFLQDIHGINILGDLSKINKAFLLFHSPTDDTVSIDHAAEIYKVLKHPKSFVSLDGADHLVTRQKDAEYIASTIAAWVQRYIPLGAQLEEVSEGLVVVESMPGYRFAQNVSSKDHHLIMDEPLSVGGDNLGFNPYQQLLAGLGGCTAMTIQMYAERKKIPLTNIKVTLSHQKKHFDDCKTCKDKPQKLDHITKQIEIHGSFTKDQHSRMLEIADMCPVNRTLQSEIVIQKVNSDSKGTPNE